MTDTVAVSDRREEDVTDQDVAQVFAVLGLTGFRYISFRNPPWRGVPADDAKGTRANPEAVSDEDEKETSEAPVGRGEAPAEEPGDKEVFGLPQHSEPSEVSAAEPVSGTEPSEPAPVISASEPFLLSVARLRRDTVPLGTDRIANRPPPIRSVGAVGGSGMMATAGAGSDAEASEPTLSSLRRLRQARAPRTPGEGRAESLAAAGQIGMTERGKAAAVGESAAEPWASQENTGRSPAAVSSMRRLRVNRREM